MFLAYEGFFHRVRFIVSTPAQEITSPLETLCGTNHNAGTLPSWLDDRVTISCARYSQHCWTQDINDYMQTSERFRSSAASPVHGAETCWLGLYGGEPNQNLGLRQCMASGLAAMTRAPVAVAVVYYV